MSSMNVVLRLLAAFCLVCVQVRAGASEARSGLALARQLNEAFVEVAAKVSPAVVVITVVQKPAPISAQSDDSLSDPLPRDFWRFFHKQYEEQAPEKSIGQGSGIIIRPDGYVLTNGHVVEDTESIEVRLHDGRLFKAKLCGLDPLSDVAVVKIDAKGLPIAVLADSDKTRVGEFAIAIGAPYNLDYSVTFGHVSAKGRWNVIDGYEGATMDQDFIQTDALINPGNSGGPLLNIDGEVIGLNTLIRGFHSGIGFAVPSNLAKEVSDQLIAKGKYSRAWLGVAIHGLRDDPETVRSLNGPSEGVVVERILPGGPAAKSELARNDVIVAVEGKHVSTTQQLRAEIRSKPIGNPVRLEVFRDGKNLQVRVTPTEMAESSVLAGSQPSPALESHSDTLGLVVHTLTRGLADRFGLSVTNGVLVLGVEEGTPAARQGIKRGDIITSLDHQSVSNANQFHESLKKADLKKGVTLSLLSGKAARSETLKENGE
ncbi:2-alkenal reductase [Verrucomicrobia bacterium]|nr:2-alkenal reductase [Verrucomicrobiota bacterium]